VTLRQALKYIMLREVGTDARFSRADDMVVEVLRWRREKPEAFEQLLRIVAWSSEPRPPVYVVPDQFRAGPVPVTLHEIELDALVTALRRHRWVQKAAAQELGISPRVMNYKVREFQIVPDEGFHWHKHGVVTGAGAAAATEADLDDLGRSAGEREDEDDDDEYE
jgi:transcriptional regulator of acetoin/glycerol metabolism